MTTLARTEPSLRRLFESLDYAGEPRSDALREIMKVWRSARGNSVWPSIDSVAALAAPDAFLFAVGSGDEGLTLIAGGSSLDHFLGHLDRGQTIARSLHPRGAARLRRLFESVVEAGEPVVAEFHDHQRGEFVEVLAAPVSADGETVGGVYGGLAWRRSETGRAHPHAAPVDAPVVFALGSSSEFGSRVCAELGLALAPHEERGFEDGEFKIRPLTNVRNRDVFVIAGLNGDEKQSASDKLCRLLFFTAALKDGAAARVTAVAPYLCYGRKDRQTKPRDPVSSRYVAQLFEAVGTDRLITLEAHNLAAFQNAFRCDTEHLDADALFARHFKSILGPEPIVVLSPDTGGIKRAERFRERIQTELARPIASGFMEKRRSGGTISGETLVADVDGCAVIIFDDLISTGGTMSRAAAACRARGATAVYAVAAHGLLNRGAGDTLRAGQFAGVVVTDSVAPRAAEAAAIADNLHVVSIAGLFAETIRRCHTGGSIVALLEGSE